MTALLTGDDQAARMADTFWTIQQAGRLNSGLDHRAGASTGLRPKRHQAGDFSGFLTEEESARFDALAAEQVSACEPYATQNILVPPENEDASRQRLRKMAEILQLDRYGNLDAFAFGQRLRRRLDELGENELDSRIIQIRTPTDSVGDRYFAVYCVFDEGTPKETRWEAIDRLEQIGADVASGVSVDVSTYSRSEWEAETR